MSPLDDDDKYPGSTLTPTTVTALSVVSKEVHADLFSLSGTTVDSISHDHEDRSQDHLVSAKALGDAQDKLQTAVDNLMQEVEDIYYVPVLSDPIIDPYFVDPNWVFNGFFIDYNKAVYICKTSATTNQAMLRVKSEAITKKGTYFFHVIIDQLPSGQIVLLDDTGATLKTFTLPGDYSFEVEVDNPDITYWDFVVNKMKTNDTVIISLISIHHVKNIFQVYLDYLTEKLSSGGSGFVTNDQLDQRIDEIINSYQTYVNDVIKVVNDNLALHIADQDNPHGTTPDKIGAATKNHTHTPISIGAADRDHTHTLQDITDAKDLIDAVDNLEDLLVDYDDITAKITAHINNKNNPHGVTPAQIGAATADHTHTLESLGAAATNHNHDTVYSKLTHDHDAVYSKLNHTHTPASIGAANVKHTHFLDDIQDIQTIYDLIDSVTGGNAQLSTDFYAFRTEAREQMKENKDNLAAHIADKDNPHEVTKTQVGLSLVYNGSMATQAEAADATNTTTYLNPKAGSALIDSKLATVGTEINRVTPTYIATLTLDNTSNLTDRIMIYPNRIYMIVFSSKHITNLKNVSMFLSGEDVATTVRNSIFLTQTLTVGSSSVETLVRHTYTSEMYEFVAPDTGVTSASGTLFFDTSSYLLSGILGGIVQNESGTEITSVNYPMVYSSSLTVDSTPENAEYLVFEINSSQVSTKASFTIFEIAKWNEEPALMVDATPVGTIVSRPLDAYAPGYSLLDGSELSRENNPELFTFAETNNLIKSQTEYDTAVTTNGYCEYFGSGDGTSTFTIPTAKTDSSSIYKQYMKIKKLTIPGEQEVLYRFTWLDE